MAHHRLSAPCGASEQRTQPSVKLVEVKRLHQVVVCPRVKAGDALLDLVTRRDDEDRKCRVWQRRLRRALRQRKSAQSLQELRAVTVYQPKIQNQRIESFAAQGTPTALHTLAQIHRVSALTQIGSQAFGNACIVFDHQDSHTCILAAVASISVARPAQRISGRSHGMTEFAGFWKHPPDAVRALLSI